MILASVQSPTSTTSGNPGPFVPPRLERFVKAPESLLFGRPDLTTTELACLLAIRHHDWTGEGCWPSNATLRKACRLKDPGGGSLRRLLAGLVRKGHIRVQRVEQSPVNRTGRVFHLLIPPAATASTPVRRGTRRERIGAPRIDSLERKDSASNVPNDNGSANAREDQEQAGEPEPAKGCPTGMISGAAQEVEPKAISNPIGDTPVPPVSPAAPHLVAITTPRERAERLFRRLRDRGLILELHPDPERGEVIRPRRLTEYVEHIQDDEAAELVAIRADVLEFLGGASRPVASNEGVAEFRVVEYVAGPTTTTIRAADAIRSQPPGAIQGGEGKPARPVPASVQASVRRLIAGLPGNPDPKAHEAAVNALAEALSDRKPPTLAMLHGLARDVWKGRLAVGCLLDGFEAGCGRTARNRGAVFVASVKRSRCSARREK